MPAKRSTLNLVFLTSCLLVTILLPLDSAFAEISFSGKIPLSGYTNGASGAVGADVDGDGDLDVVCSAATDQKIAWYENLDGEGNFGPQKLIATGFDGACDVTCADVDGDGDLDVLAAANQDHKVSWFENTDGQGTFSAEQVLSDSIEYVALVFARDVNGDSYTDLMYSSPHEDGFGYFLNQDGLGTFGPQQIIDNIGIIIRNLIVPDIDSDGDPDIVAVNNHGDSLKVELYENMDGAGTYAVQQMLTSSTTTWSYGLHADDLDRDGDTDLILTDGSSLMIYDNVDGGGTFTVDLIDGSMLNGIGSVCCVDLGDDGDQDIIAASYRYLYSYTNQSGQNDFGDEQLLTEIAGDGSRLHACDLNGDGLDDVLAAAKKSDGIAWYPTLPAGAGLGGKRIISDGTVDPVVVRIADMNGDGYDDIIAALYEDDRIVWFENIHASGEFEHQQVLSPFSYTAADIYPADLDNDGDIDLLAATQWNQQAFWYENLENTGEFDEHILTTLIYGVVAICAADLDGDGDQDAVTASAWDDTIAWYENTDGQGGFAPRSIVSTLSVWPQAVSACDLNGDGDLDLLSASKEDHKVAWYENTDGAGQFGTEQILSNTLANPECVHAADLDGDGDLDVLIADSGDDNIGWFENLDGAGSFGSLQVIEVNVMGANDLACVDLDNDGDLDLLSAARDNNWYSWHENLDGQGNFGERHRLCDFSGSPESIACADFDQDGDIDVAGASNSDGMIEWYRNELISTVPDHPTAGTLASGFALRAIYPNPFNAATKIQVDLAAPAELTVAVFNTLGQRVALLSDGPVSAGSQEFVFNASGMASGIYFVQATVPGHMNTVQKIVLMK